jgi:hypothetical protein
MEYKKAEVARLTDAINAIQSTDQSKLGNPADGIHTLTPVSAYESDE